MRATSGIGRGQVRIVVRAVLSICVVASALTIVVAAPPPAEATSARDSWYVGPNSPDAIANEITYFGVPFTPRFYGIQIPVTHVGAGGFSTWDGVGQLTTYPAQWKAVVGPTEPSTFSVNLPGATITQGFVQHSGGASPGISISCASDTCAAGMSSFQITRTYAGTYQSIPCVHDYFASPGDAQVSLDEACPAQYLEGTQVRTVVAGPEPTQENLKPTAVFTSTQSSTDPFEFSFSSRSSDDRDAQENLGHSWDFGDDKTSTEVNPTHRYEKAGEHTVTLTVTDSGGLTDVTSQKVTISSGLVVNSTGDQSALDPAQRGCDTGDKVGDDPECTLRAAIETAESQGGGDISFDIDGGGVPTIAAASPLPAITTSVTIDGTTQDGGFVGVTGGGEALLTLADGTSRVTGLVIDRATDAVTVTGGSDHVIEGNRFGTDAAGTADGDLTVGVVAIGSSGLVVRDNVIVASAGVQVGPDATGVQIVKNSIGVNKAGTASLGETKGAVLAIGPDVEVRDNVLRGKTVGVELAGATATGAKIEGNTVGLNKSGTATLDDTGYGIRVDGAPGVTINANKVSSPGWGAILVSGTVQIESNDDDSINLISPATEIEDQPITGGSATVSGNTIGLVSGNQASDPAIQRGVYTWSGADDVTVSANTIGGATNSGIELETGARHKITGNRIGIDASGSTEVAVHEGITLSKTTDVTVGGTGSDVNKVVAESQGVNLIGTTVTTNVAGNTITGANGAGNFYGIYAGQGATGVTLDSNVLTKGSIGVRNETAGTTITKNTVSNFTEFGIKSRGWTATITGNVSSGNGVGISASGKDLNVSLNRVGLDGATDTVIGNTGKGIDIGEASTAELTRNIVAGSGEQGIYVINGSTATLRANRILSTTGKPIDAAGAPDAPTLVGAARSTNGTSTRTTLILADLPKGDAGTIEVFANKSCSDPEAEIVMDITRTKKIDEEVRIIQIIGNATRDNYTVTYTDAGGHTSELSGCAEAKTYGDADGDGSQDPFDAILGQKDDPTKALIPTDTEELLFIGTASFDEETGEGGGDLSDIKVIDDPAPGTHTTDWKLPYGVISFRINGLKPGAATSVMMTTITGGSPLAGTSYWKYGSPTPGAADRWYKFDYDEATRTGAQLSGAIDVPGFGLRRAFQLDLRDGARGDNDGGANGTITDPGGPVTGGDTDTPPATDTTTLPATTPPTTPPAANTPTDPAPTGGGATVGGVVTSPGGSATNPAPSSPNTTGTSSGGPLAFTGNNPLALLLIAAALILTGTIAARRQRRLATRKTG